MDVSATSAVETSGDPQKIVSDTKEPEVEECAICFDAITQLAKLPCSCKVAYCMMCWDQALAQSYNACWQSRCPTCRIPVRVDYDAETGCLVFSREVPRDEQADEEDAGLEGEPIRRNRMRRMMTSHSTALEDRRRISAQTRPAQLRLLREFGAANPLPQPEASIESGIQAPAMTFQAAAAIAACAAAVRPQCVCRSQLERVSGLERTKRLCQRHLPYPPDHPEFERILSSFMERPNESLPVQCDLCGESLAFGTPGIWTCERGNSTILHASAYDVCESCLVRYAYNVEPGASSVQTELSQQPSDDVLVVPL
ncbi:unnamed protein product [Polarella glacialis]|uniref:RING-type domain-containing protein n=1 Tax=Polarella glacialis TaxID=89957 RepID=A0A813KPG6_POLGL|nr:unnamed protein product [Polarella glacialis]CAE8628407.1 unnamed protein product [Polarella glacialis]CAE8710006.1 unnamed protein product [Polarella glacialis]